MTTMMMTMMMMMNNLGWLVSIRLSRITVNEIAAADLGSVAISVSAK
jgi:hypothetical protein